MINKILSEFFTCYGFCDYGKISDSLLPCAAAKRLPENAETVICCLFPYNLGDDKYSGSDISKYAVVPDYHNIVTEILKEACTVLKKQFPNEEFEPFSDNSPIPEVRASVLAGLGVRGKNGLLINEEYGSWVFIGEIVTTMKLQSDGDFKSCIGCGKCAYACPNKAIGENGISKSECISDITQRKGELSEVETKLIKNSGCAWGCDICQNVCPMNFNKKINPLPAFKDGARLRADSENLDGRAYAWRGKKVIERNLKILYDKEGK